ncbi:prolyl oligopeptidase family serine peptidase [Fulvivirgaceae bacterium PWU4]|uniref:Prolyl oligopeptidase family serine peptidase n=1 Tax=Chryseosolibacter histidini TaxID=2782349 RepID=A0AAP2GLF4_9BACT|nr:lipase family protein [Chryseosolibacter histidini]MBT1695768.1 prolyl oligopeptidase family serine peptidase [Chryseosolibacter histidini]
MIKTPSITRLLFFSITWFVIACSDDNNPPPVVEKVLVESVKIESRTAQQLKTLVQFSGRDIDPSIMKYNVNTYRVTYKTTYKGDEIVASGVIALPFTTDQVGMVSVQHGTIVQQTDAPSAQGAGSFDLVVYAAMASSGFIVVVPDMIGFGQSKNIFHPYYVEEAIAQAIVDNVRAAAELAEDDDVSFNNRLFLAGYSEGGYATMAAHKAIEAEPIKDIDLVASFPAAGGYDIQAMQHYIFNQDQYPQPYYLAYVARSYQLYYEKSGLLADFFNEPYVSRIPNLFDGITSAGNINVQLSNRMGELIREDLRLNLDTDTRYAYIRNAFAENSLTDWAPSIPMYMYHGQQDTTVPYENSVTTYQKLIANGTSAETLKFIPLPGKDHTTGIDPYIDDVIKKMQQLK